MNVYDFDKTIYDGDSSIDFYFFCLKKHPEIIFCAFKQAFGILMHAIGKFKTKKMKEYFFCYLSKLKEPQKLVEAFWQKNEIKIKKWYLDKKHNSDLIISASPEFLLEPICKRLEINSPIATKMDINSGEISGENCKGEEKVKRFFEAFTDGEVDLFYSDSKSDEPLAKLSKKAYIVKKDSLSDWQ